MNLQKLPYPHCINTDFLSEEDFYILYKNIKYLEWEYYKKHSYEYYVSSLDFESPFYLKTKHVINYFISSKFIKFLSDIYGIAISKCKDATFHKMVKGHYTKRHTDSNQEGEKIRLIYYFSKPSEYEGGDFVLFSGNSDKEIFCSYKFNPNTLFGFVISNYSFHEVTEIIHGERICLILTYI